MQFTLYQKLWLHWYWITRFIPIALENYIYFECQCCFFSFLKIQNNSPPFLCSRAETVSKLTGDGLEGFRATFLDFNQCSTKRQLEKHKLLKVSVMAFTHSEIGGKTFLIKAFKLLLSFSLKASAELLNNLLKTCTKSHSSIDHTADDDYF